MALRADRNNIKPMFLGITQMVMEYASLFTAAAAEVRGRFGQAFGFHEIADCVPGFQFLWKCLGISLHTLLQGAF